MSVGATQGSEVWLDLPGRRPGDGLLSLVVVPVCGLRRGSGHESEPRALDVDVDVVKAQEHQ